MKVKSFFTKLFLFGFLFGTTLTYFGCQSKSKNNVDNEINQDMEKNDDFSNELNKTKQVFYSLPSPIETALLLKRAGAKFNEDYLNPVDNISKYTTQKSMALNLGVYSADLSFVSMFDQSQLSVKYLSATKKLADELGILNAVDQSIFKRMDSNIDNTDSLMEIISETFMNSDSFLKENDRTETAGILLVGGWIEGLYIATQIAKSTESNSEIIDRVIDQRLSLATLMSLLQEYQSNSDVKDILNQLKGIKVLYDKINISSSKTEAVTDSTGKTFIKSASKSSYKKEDINALFDKAIALRDSIVS